MPGMENKIHPMTVVVATICENGKAAIMVADRFVDFSDAHKCGPKKSGSVCKIKPLTERLMAGFYGECSTPEIEKLLSDAVSNQHTISDAADQASKVLSELRNKEEGQWLARKGITRSEWLNIITHNNKAPIIGEMENALPDIRFVLMGADQSGTRLCLCQWSGKVFKDSPGFTCQGAGDDLARFVFYNNPKIRESSFGEALFQVYHAKQVAAELSNVVTEETDIAVVWQDRDAVFLNATEIDELQRIHMAIPNLTALMAPHRKDLDNIAKRTALPS